MSPAILKLLSSMIGPNEIGAMIDDITKKLNEYKNQFALEEGEKELVIILFETPDEQMAGTIAAVNDENKVVRQIETNYLKDLFINTLKNIK